MCLGIPMQITAIDGHRAHCEAGGIEREVSLFLLQDSDVATGDYVLVHVGYAIQRLDPRYARETLALLGRLVPDGEAEPHAGALALPRTGRASERARGGTGRARREPDPPRGRPARGRRDRAAQERLSRQQPRHARRGRRARDRDRAARRALRVLRRDQRGHAQPPPLPPLRRLAHAPRERRRAAAARRRILHVTRRRVRTCAVTAVAASPLRARVTYPRLATHKPYCATCSPTTPRRRGAIAPISTGSACPRSISCPRPARARRPCWRRPPTRCTASSASR